jgi:hypothetical protein
MSGAQSRIYLLLLAILIFTIHVWHLRAIPDDAYISFRYARNLAEGHGLVWNTGERPVEGYTNFLWVILLSGMYRTGIPLEAGARFMSLVFAFCTLVLVYRVALHLWGEGEAIIAPLILALSSPFALWASSGMEISLFAFLCSLGSYLYLSRGSPVGIGAVFCLAALTRPEGLIFFGITVCHWLVARLHKKQPILSQSIFVAVVSFVVPYTVYFLWRYHYYGFFLPNTFYTKVGSTAAQIVRGVKYAAAVFVVTVLPALVVLAPLLRSQRPAIAYCLSIIGAVTGYIVLVGGDYMTMFRFFVPLMPYMALLLAALLPFLLRRFRPSFRAALYCILALLSILPSLNLEAVTAYAPVPEIYWRMRSTTYPRLSFERWSTNRFKLIGRWLASNVSAQDSLAFEAIGVIGYYCRLKILDMSGLNDLHIAHLNPSSMGQGLAGHEKQDFLYILSKKPDYILFSPRFFKSDERDITVDVLYSGRLQRYPQADREFALRQLRTDYRLRFVPLSDDINQESGFLLLLERI